MGLVKEEEWVVVLGAVEKVKKQTEQKQNSFCLGNAHPFFPNW